MYIKNQNVYGGKVYIVLISNPEKYIWANRSNKLIII